MRSSEEKTMLLHLSRSARIAASIAVLAATLASSAAFASPNIGVTADPANGNILTDERGMTLYRYTSDQPNSSTCYNGCARAWPPVVVDALPEVADPAIAIGLGLAPRTDGTQQLSYMGAPLYYYVGDTQPGETTGQASDDVWFVVNP
jgi:predicted lipoprotein with Yx(FWY)xxD motif